MALLKMKKLIEDLENNSSLILSSVEKVATTAGNAGTAYLATTAAFAGTSYKATTAQYASSAGTALAP